MEIMKKPNQLHSLFAGNISVGQYYVLGFDCSSSRVLSELHRSFPDTLSQLFEYLPSLFSTVLLGLFISGFGNSLREVVHMDVSEQSEKTAYLLLVIKHRHERSRGCLRCTHSILGTRGSSITMLHVMSLTLFWQFFKSL
jgi:hypothetical protein